MSQLWAGSLPPRHRTVPARVRSADWLLLPGSDDLAYSPSTIHRGHMTGRFIPALAHHGSQPGRQVFLAP